MKKKGDLDFRTKDGYVKIANKEIYSDFNERLKEEGLDGVSPHKFKEYLTELGFSDVTNRKKLEVKLPDEDEPQSRMCNIFNDRVLRKLGIEESVILGPREKEILNCLEDGGKSAEEIGEDLGIEKEIVKKTLKALCNAELVEEAGEKVGGGMVYEKATDSQEEIVEKILEFYEEYGDPECTVARFLDSLAERFDDLNRDELRPHVERLKENGEITLAPEVGEVEDLGGGSE